MKIKNGDCFTKPTAFWFFGSKPFRFKTFQAAAEHKTIEGTHERKEKGVCSEKRSLNSFEYARNFIADYVLGISSKPGLMQQLDLFTT